MDWKISNPKLKDHELCERPYAYQVQPCFEKICIYPFPLPLLNFNLNLDLKLNLNFTSDQNLNFNSRIIRYDSYSLLYFIYPIYIFDPLCDFWVELDFWFIKNYLICIKFWILGTNNWFKWIIHERKRAVGHWRLILLERRSKTRSYMFRLWNSCMLWERYNQNLKYTSDVLSWRVNWRTAPGQPEIVFCGQSTALFTHFLSRNTFSVRNNLIFSNLVHFSQTLETR